MSPLFIYDCNYHTISDIPLTLTHQNHNGLHGDSLSTLMNIQTLKGIGAMENTKQRILISVDRAFQSRVYPTKDGIS